jgi:hypothetical protein
VQFLFSLGGFIAAYFSGSLLLVCLVVCNYWPYERRQTSSDNSTTHHNVLILILGLFFFVQPLMVWLDSLSLAHGPFDAAPQPYDTEIRGVCCSLAVDGFFMVTSFALFFFLFCWFNDFRIVVRSIRPNFTTIAFRFLV